MPTSSPGTDTSETATKDTRHIAQTRRGRAQQPDRVVRIDIIRLVDALRLHVLVVLIVVRYGLAATA
jgi:hypothetical protein